MMISKNLYHKMIISKKAWYNKNDIEKEMLSEE